jgi:hypothetical protein
MNNKDEVYRLLMENKFERLLGLFDQQPNMVRKYVTMATHHREAGLRQQAVNFFGFLAEKRAVSRLEFFKETIRRHLWNMNEESGNTDWSAPEIIGAIIAAQPELFKEFAPVMIEAALAEPIFHQGLMRAVERMAAHNTELIEYHLPRLKELGFSPISVKD